MKKWGSVLIVALLLMAGFLAYVTFIPTASAGGGLPVQGPSGSFDSVGTLTSNITAWVNHTTTPNFWVAVSYEPCIGKVAVTDGSGNWVPFTKAGCHSPSQTGQLQSSDIWYYKGSLSAAFNQFHWGHTDTDYPALFVVGYSNVDNSQSVSYSDQYDVNFVNIGLYAVGVSLSRSQIAIGALSLEYENPPNPQAITGPLPTALYGIGVGDAKYGLPCIGRTLVGFQQCLGIAYFPYPVTGVGFSFWSTPAVRREMGWIIFSGPPFVAPTVQTVAASSIGSISAVLNGNLTDMGSETPIIVGFLFGLNSTLIGATNITVGNETSAVVFSQLVGTAKNTTYYFRAWANSTAGYSQGSILNFTSQIDPSDVLVAQTLDFAIIFLFFAVCATAIILSFMFFSRGRKHGRGGRGGHGFGGEGH